MTNKFFLMAAWSLMAFGSSVAAAPLELTPLGNSLASEGFELIAREQGVKVYKHKESEIIRIAAEGRFAYSPRQVLDALLDYEGQLGVVERVSKSQILDRGPSWILVYQQLNLPIISDRDYVMYVDWGANGDTLFITYRAGSHRGPPEQDGVVRVTDHRGSWQLKPILGGKATFARYQVTIDLAGWLPKWLARSKAGEELPGLFQDIRRMLTGSEPADVACLMKPC